MKRVAWYCVQKGFPKIKLKGKLSFIFGDYVIKRLKELKTSGYSKNETRSKKSQNGVEESNMP